MRYFYIFILTLILISCNEKKGYSHTPVIEFGEGVYGISLSECRDVVVKGKIIREIQNSDTKSFRTLMYHKGYIYRLKITEDDISCLNKKKFHDKWINVMNVLNTLKSLRVKWL